MQISKIFMSILFLGAVTIWVSCKNEQPAPPPPPSVSATDQDSLMEDFYAFYRAFHQDSAFQMAHILWPLKGLPKQVDSATLAANNFYWTPDNWRIHRPVDFEVSEFKRELTPVGSGLIIERIVHKQGGFGMVRRFSIIDDEWHLIYFSDLNKFE
jgi:hypothetical protein